MNFMVQCRRWLAAGTLLVGFTGIGLADDGAAAASKATANSAQKSCVIIGYRYEIRYVCRRAGLFGCRCRCRPVCCAIPIYAGDSNDNAVNIDNEGSGEVRASKKAD